jgi:uncharacterized membrane protein YoaK (UPF0700 family)
VGGGRARRIALTAVALTAGTGGIDVVSFTRLGGVFTSVMTANIVLLGLSIARASGTLAGHTALSVGCYVAGVAAAARAIGPSPPEPPARPAQPPPPKQPEPPGAAGRAWPGRVTAVLGAELLLLAGLTAGWELTGGRPAGAEQYLLQGIAAAAMGMQSAAVRGIGTDEFSTTYLTGQLTKLVSTLAVPGKRRWPGWHMAGPLLALIGGAVLSGVLIATAPDAIPLITLVPLAGVLTAESLSRRRRAGR